MTNTDTPEASGTARKAPSVSSSGDTSRIIDRASPTPSAWQPIETAPKDESTFLIAQFLKPRNPIFLSQWIFALACWRLDGKSVPRWDVLAGGHFDGATHWMPLPEAPKP